MKISDIENVSARTRHVLEWSEFETVEELTPEAIRALHSMRNCGNVTMLDVCAALADVFSGDLLRRCQEHDEWKAQRFELDPDEVRQQIQDKRDARKYREIAWIVMKGKKVCSTT